ncbi:hypothetical protein CM07_gp16 [Mycobacterium phage Alma]|uniref:Uncharacterized protein n=1 Tax=Mycobacterium phage Alma TaxID=2902800 RepID=G8I7V9_9CAUD|nr:hypothetical protein CM07_gp16 [Mycobacterium phage Alma]AER48798.1 hypothetical protein ALMA_90 [Mycobacterium phage Alma]
MFDDDDIAQMEGEDTDEVLAAIDVLARTLRYSVKDNLQDDWIA